MPGKPPSMTLLAESEWKDFVKENDLPLTFDPRSMESLTWVYDGEYDNPDEVIRHLATKFGKGQR